MSDTIYKRLDYDQTLFLTNLIFQHMKGSPLNTQYTLALSADKSAYELKASVDGGTPTVVATISGASAEAAGLLSASLYTKLLNIEEGAQVNRLEGVSVNGVVQTIDGKTKAVDIVVPTKTSDLTNDSNFLTAEEIANAIKAAMAGSLQPAGSIAFADLPANTAENVNKIFNITDSFSTNANFVEEAGVEYPAGTNVAIINVGTIAEPDYKYDTYTGVIDLAPYVKHDEMKVLTNQEITAAVTSAYNAVFGE